MNDLLLQKTQPQNIDAEEAVLSAIFINSSLLENIPDLKPEYFYKGAHKKIFAAVKTIEQKKEPIDLVSVAQELISRKELESVGGASYLTYISDSVPIAINVKNYAKIVMELAKARELITIASGIIEQGFNYKDIEEYISDSQAKILQVQTTTSQDKIHTMESLVHEALDRIQDAQTRQIEIGYKLGFPTLDTCIQVFGSKLILIAGRPGMGKTALALSIAKYLALREVKVGFLSIEMDKESLTDRLLSIESDINSLCFYARQTLGPESMVHLTNSAELLSTLPIYVDDSDCKIQDVERKCRKMKKLGCDVIFIDQLSKIRGKSNQTKFESYTENCSSIALLKKELRMPIFLLCQLNRAVEATNDKKPSLSHLKQTGMLEEDADMVFLLFRPGYYDEDADPSRTEIILAKNRQGALGTEHQVLFKQKRGMFQLI
jgi:replicative DNA helicase